MGDMLREHSTRLQGVVCTLRGPSDADVEDVVELLSDRAFSATWSLNPELPESRTQVRDRILHAKPNRHTFVITLPDDTFVGLYELYLNNYQRHRICANSILLNRRYSGRGIGFDARVVMTHFMFAQLNAFRVVGRFVASNERSRRQAARLGAAECGRLRNAIYLEGAYHDVIMWTLNAESFYAAANDHVLALPSSRTTE